jgi:hypothetical protein
MFGGATLNGGGGVFSNKVSLNSTHLSDDVEKLVGVVWFPGNSSGWRDLRIIMELHRRLFHLLRLRDGCGLLDSFGNFSSATNNVMPGEGEAAPAASHHTIWSFKIKGISRILL